MRKTIVATAVALMGVAASVSANAAESDNPSGFYVGAGWGQFNLDVDGLDEAGSAIESIVETDSNAWKIFTGYRLNPYLAFEAAYIDFGSANDRFEASGSDGNYEIDVSGFAPYVIGTIPLGPVELFGKVGYYFYDIDVNVDLDAPGPDVDSSHSDSNFLYGGGLGVTLFERLNVRAEYEIIDLDRAPNSDAMWLSASWRF
jgi:opacity protein-like surface antigen